MLGPSRGMSTLIGSSGCRHSRYGPKKGTEADAVAAWYIRTRAYPRVPGIDEPTDPSTSGVRLPMSRRRRTIL
jgi:hypothetical protein